MPDERRRHVRKQVDLTARYQVDDGEAIEGHVSDLSLGGAFIDTEDAAPFGSRVKLSMTLPTGMDLVAEGIVRWRQPDGMGIQFGTLGAKQTYRLTEFLADVAPDPGS